MHLYRKATCLRMEGGDIFVVHICEEWNEGETLKGFSYMWLVLDGELDILKERMSEVVFQSALLFQQ